MTMEQLNIAQRLLTHYTVGGENLQLLILQDERCAIARDDEILRLYDNAEVEKAAMDFLHLTRQPPPPIKTPARKAPATSVPAHRLCIA